MEEKSGPVENQAPADEHRTDSPDDDSAKRPAGYAYLRDPRIEHLYGIDPWGNDWGE
jgi:hypothetical protein